jgi:copper chaperone CopZ
MEKEIKLQISVNMESEVCVNKIKELLENEKNIKEFEINFVKQEILITTLLQTNQIIDLFKKIDKKA